MEKKFPRGKVVTSVVYLSSVIQSGQSIIIKDRLGNKHFVNGSYYHDPETGF